VFFPNKPPHLYIYFVTDFGFELNFEPQEQTDSMQIKRRLGFRNKLRALLHKSFKVSKKNIEILETKHYLGTFVLRGTVTKSRTGVEEHTVEHK